MSNLSTAIKNAKQKNINFFFGEVHNISNKYFKFNHVEDEDNIRINTNNIKFIKGNPVLIVGNHEVVYLKDWQVRECHNFDNGCNFFVVKLNRNYFKTYTFKNPFDVDINGSQTFDDLKAVAEQQDRDGMPVALGWME